MKRYHVIGMMSGTSLDGVDLAHCSFCEDRNVYTYKLGICETIPYPADWLDRLIHLPNASASEYAETHVAYGRFVGGLICDFIRRNHLKAHLVASHGHTVFHQPSLSYTSQIGDGAAIAASCGMKVVCDFRSADVAAGGQGAPLVPMGDEMLFSDYDYCLNLGGFANISMRIDGKRVAFDISPANIILNHIANLSGKSFDRDGELAASGKVNLKLLESLNSLKYYQELPPKSLGREWVEEEMLPLLKNAGISPEDAASTFCEHIATQIAACTQANPSANMLVTGGGAFNKFLMNRIAAHVAVQIIVPEAKTVNYKEALVFAFLGLLRMQGKPNCLASVTGASKNVSGGAVYLP